MPYRRGSKWYICIAGKRISSGFTEEKDARQYEQEQNRLLKLARQQAAVKQAERRILGLQPARSWKEAVVRWCSEKAAKRTLEYDKMRLQWWDGLLNGVTDLNLITREMIDAHIQAKRPVTLSAHSSANTTANMYVATVSQVLRAAEKVWGWGNRAPNLRLYPASKGREICPTAEQVLRLVAELPEHSSDLCLFAAATMLRRGNLTGLKWAQIDFAAETLKIRGEEMKAGKDLLIPLNKTAIGVLLKRRNAQTRHITHVFTFEGKPIKSVVTEGWRKACKRAGCEGVVLHSMRHAANSWLMNAGVSKEFRARLGGWATSGDAQDGYSHASIEALREVACKLDPMLCKKGEGKAVESPTHSQFATQATALKVTQVA